MRIQKLKKLSRAKAALLLPPVILTCCVCDNAYSIARHRALVVNHLLVDSYGADHRFVVATSTTAIRATRWAPAAAKASSAMRSLLATTAASDELRTSAVGGTTTP